MRACGAQRGALPALSSLGAVDVSLATLKSQLWGVAYSAKAVWMVMVAWVISL